MSWERIATLTVFSSATPGNEREFDLRPMPLGVGAKSALYMLRVLQKNSSLLELGLRLDHGPDGTAAITHSTPIVTTTFSATMPTLRVGQADTSKMLCAWLHPVVVADISSGTAEAMATLEVYQMLKRI